MMPWTVRVMSLVSLLTSATAESLTGNKRPSLRVTSRVTSLLAKGAPLPWSTRTDDGLGEAAMDVGPLHVAAERHEAGGHY